MRDEELDAPIPVGHQEHDQDQVDDPKKARSDVEVLLDGPHGAKQPSDFEKSEKGEESGEPQYFESGRCRPDGGLARVPAL